MNTIYALPKPILFLVFNRPSETSKVFDEIRRAKPSKLYISCDGPRPEKGNDEKELVDQVRKICNNIDWECIVKLLYHESNLGCKKAVSEGINWFFDNEEMGIILEDDCLPSPDFFYFCNYLLDIYKDDLRVMHIGGTNPIQNKSINYKYSYYFSLYNRIWGWASWRRAWKFYDVEMKSWPEVRDSGILSKLLGPKSYSFYQKTFDAVYYNSIDTWDYQWFYSRLLQGLAVIPTVNLISNIGFINNNATHTFSSNSPLANLPVCSVKLPITHPPFMLPDYRLDNEWARVSQSSLFSRVFQPKTILKKLFLK